ncbi:hypothetical protein GQ53DRAFT_846305 [Thozetella sp. PMI_491]|nr:hypothetical protein GQ53DRAFT_846305 [Thozetella sp. PMI_491]
MAAAADGSDAVAACRPCRQTRLNCGLEEPSCHNCVASKQRCPGYLRGDAAALAKTASPETDQPASQADATARRTKRGLVEKRSSADAQSLSDPRSGRPRPPRMSARPSSSHQQHRRPVSFPRQISARSAFRQHLLSLYLTSYFPPEVLRASKHIAPKQRNWLLHLVDVEDASPALEGAILATCAARLGIQDQHANLRQQSLIQYGGTLREMQNALCHPTLRNSDQTLAAAMALAFYEFTECPGGLLQGYEYHYRGAMELLKYRGPAVHVFGLAHGVFRALRMHTALRAIADKSPSFLADEDWLTLPWVSQRKDLFDKIVDILLVIPRILAQTDVAQREEMPLLKMKGILRSVQMCWGFDATLQEWFSRINASVRGPLYRPVLSTIDTAADNPKSGRLFPVSYRFCSFFVGQNLVLYWMTSVILSQHLCRLYRGLGLLKENAALRRLAPCTCPEPRTQEKGKEKETKEPLGATELEAAACLRHFDPDQLPPLGSRIEWGRTVAYEICRSAEYFLDNETRCLGPNTLFPALRVLRAIWSRTPGDWTRELAWLRDVITIMQSKGISVPRYSQEEEHVVIREVSVSGDTPEPDGGAEAR